MAEKRMDYTTISSNDLTILNTEVKKLLVEGWLPQGGLAIATYNVSVGTNTEVTKVMYAQALIREEVSLDSLVLGEVFTPVVNDPETSSLGGKHG